MLIAIACNYPVLRLKSEITIARLKLKASEASSV